jgi:hypothetical protein
LDQSRANRHHEHHADAFIGFAHRLARTVCWFYTAETGLASV